MANTPPRNIRVDDELWAAAQAKAHNAGSCCRRAFATYSNSGCPSNG
jgi:hypothetical protein